MNNFLSKSILGLALGITATVGVNAAGTLKADKNSAEFSKFIYQGKDRVYQENPY